MWDHNTDSDYQARYGLPLSATGRIRRARIMLRPRDNEDQKVLESEIAPGAGGKSWRVATNGASGH